jgi:hypothetical protein
MVEHAILVPTKNIFRRQKRMELEKPAQDNVQPVVPRSVSFQEQFDFISASLPESHGILDAGSGGNCAPNSLAYLLFGSSLLGSPEAAGYLVDFLGFSLTLVDRTM